VVRLYGQLHWVRITPAKTRIEIASLFDESLPEESQPSTSVIETNGVEVMYVWGKRMLYPLGTQDFKTVQSENPRILSEIHCRHFWEG